MPVDPSYEPDGPAAAAAMLAHGAAGRVSLGSLGVITSVTFQLAPIAPASRTVVARFARAADAVAAALELAAAASLTPSALDVIAPEPRLLVRFDTTPQSAQHMAQSAA